MPICATTIPSILSSRVGIVALAGHEIDAIESIYFNDELVTLGGTDSEWVRDGRIVGLGDTPFVRGDIRDLQGQRGLRFL